MAAWRAGLILVSLTLFGAVLVGRLAVLQIVDQGFYKALAQGQQSIRDLTRGERGEIFIADKNGELVTLATSHSVSFAFLSPAEIEDPREVAQNVAPVLGVSEEFVQQRASKRESLFEVLKKDITPEERAKIAELQLAGVYAGNETERAYPQNTLASHLLGFTNEDAEGQYGIEERYEATLRGKEGVKMSGTTPGGQLFLTNEQPEDGADLTLTLDYNIQKTAETLLKEAADALDVKEGNVIVMDPSTGAVLALANIPAFDPNQYGRVEDLSVFVNGAVQKLFEPGSVFKPITMASAMNEGVLTPDTAYTDAGELTIGQYTIKNYNERVFGEQTMAQVLQFSINTGAVFAERQLGHDKFAEYAGKFGFFEPTGIDLPGEIYSQNAELQKGYEITYATAAFGQGIEVTPMQLVRAFSAIANNGLMVTPHVVKEVRGPGMTNVARPTSRRVLSSRTSSQLTAMLVSVVEDGFGKAARVPGYYVAGKTGTAQVSNSALGIAEPGYSEQTIQSFVGFAPAFDPQFLVLVKLHNPKARTAEYSAVPVFADLMKYLLDYKQIPPDYQVE